MPGPAGDTAELARADAGEPAGDAPQPAREKPVTVIQPPTRWSAGLRELWQYRELVGFLTWRDVSVRYKQTALGVAWAVIQPLATMVIFAVIFGHLAKIPSEGIPYPVFAYCGLLPWQFFSYSMTQSGMSMVMNTNLITKTYFPRLVLPLATVSAGLIDFAIAAVILGVLMVIYGVAVPLTVLLLPLLVVFMLITALGVGLWLASLSVEYRDVQYVIPFLVQFLLFLTPIVYPPTLVPEEWRFVLGLNPMAGVVESFRWAVLGIDPSGQVIGISVLTSLLLLAGGVWNFRRLEDFFADRI